MITNQRLVTFTLIGVLSIQFSYAMTQEELDKEMQRAEKISKAWAENEAPEPKEHDPECSKQWDFSSAKNTCITDRFITQDPVGTCQLFVQCLGTGSQIRTLPDTIDHKVAAPSWQYKQHTRIQQYFSAPLTKTNTLVNCDGTLKYSSCP
jgi:hypothetical protein